MTEDKDHPRGCGENTAYKSSSSYHLGSPPRMRGKRRDGTLLPASTGITPADAGKTYFLRILDFCIEDHPRGCGENDRWNCISTANKGSPPQVRGKHDDRIFVTVADRITPAGAGKTINLCPDRAIARDHPRRCGENLLSNKWRVLIGGSPPQVRGKHEYSDTVQQTNRITPAGAGKTLSVARKYICA